MSIREFEVTRPPTSVEVEDLVLDTFRAHRQRTPIQIRLRSLGEDIPRVPTELELTAWIHSIRMRREGGLQMVGDAQDGGSVVVRTGLTPHEPATASLVTQDVDVVDEAHEAVERPVLYLDRRRPYSHR